MSQVVLGGMQFAILMVYEEKVRRKEVLKTQEKEGSTTGEVTQESSGRNPDQPGRATLCQ